MATIDLNTSVPAGLTTILANATAPPVLKQRQHIVIAGEGSRNPANADVNCTAKDAGAEINTAIQSLTPGGKIEFAGQADYDVQTKIVWDRNMLWQGSGISSRSDEPGAQNDPGTRFLLNDSFTDDAMIEIYKVTGDTNIPKATMRDLVLDGNSHAAATANSNAGVIGLMFRGREGHIDNVHIMGFSNYNLVCQANAAGDKKTQDSRFIDCRFGYSRNGNVVLGQNSSDLHFIACDNKTAGGKAGTAVTAITAAPAWIFLPTGGGNIQILGGQTYECKYGFWFKGGGSFASIGDHRLENTWEHAVWFDGDGDGGSGAPDGGAFWVTFSGCTFRENCKAATNTYDVFHFSGSAPNLIGNINVHGGRIMRTSTSYRPRYAFGRSGTSGSALQKLLVTGVLFGPYVDGTGSDHFGSGHLSMIDNNYYKFAANHGLADVKSSLVA